MSIREDILNQTVTDLEFINGNGYLTRLKGVEIGYVPLSVDNDLDRGYVFMGPEKVSDRHSDGTPSEYEADLFVIIQLGTSEGDGKLTTAIEAWIEEVKKWAVSGMKAVAGITSNKWLTLNTMAGGKIEWGSVSIKEITPYMDWKATPQIAEIWFTLNVNYKPVN